MPSVNDVLMGRARAASMRVKRKRADPTTPSTTPPGRSGAPPLPKTRRAALFSSPSSSAHKPASAPQQTYIDVGQRSFGQRSTCQTCGLLYTVGEEEDEKEHAAFCKRVRKGVTIPKWKNERLLKAFPEAKARIIEIRAGDPAAHVSKLHEIKTLLDDALGFVEEDAFLRRGLLVYVDGKRAVGCVTVESVSRAVPVDPAAPSVELSVDVQASPDEVTDGKEALVGVSQVWVHPAFRRRGIATRLLDAARDSFIYGMRIPVDAVAFAQPTQNGLALAKAYVAPHAVLVYES